MSDIVERLKSPREVCEHGSQRAKCPYCEVAELESDNARLRAALTRLVAWEGPVELACPELGGLLKAMYDARAALEAKD